MQSSVLLTLTRPTLSRAVFARSSAHNKHRARVPVLAVRSSMDASLPLLTQRIQQLKDAERHTEWPGYSNWRQSKVPKSSWSGYSEWRMNDKEEEQRIMASLRLRLSKPAIVPVEDAGAETDHFNRSSSLEDWHRSCWQQYKDSAAFDDSPAPPDADNSSRTI